MARTFRYTNTKTGTAADERERQHICRKTSNKQPAAQDTWTSLSARSNAQYRLCIYESEETITGNHNIGVPLPKKKA
jgi:hypothetical protein